LLQATAELELAEVSVSYGPVANAGTSRSPGTGNRAGTKTAKAKKPAKTPR
jgi:hypothetical protein